MKAFLNLLQLALWVAATYGVWWVFSKATDLEESQGDLNGEDHDTKA